jgi:hypothetical protein
MNDYLTVNGYALGAGPIPGQTTPGSTKIFFNNRRGLDASAHAGHASHWSPGDTAAEVAVHEFGHVLFSFGDTEETMPMETAYKLATRDLGHQPSPQELAGYISRAVSGYAANGKQRNHELAAEAFHDVRRNGLNASELSRAIYDLLVEGYNLRLARERRLGR